MSILIAITGGVFGVLLSSVAPRRLEALVLMATGALLGVTAFDILPEAKLDLSWVRFLASLGFGYFFMWIVGKRIFHVCPSCAIAHLDLSTALQGKRAIMMLGIALGIHCAMDGLAIVAGGELPVRVGLGVLVGVGLHKLPEGLALALLLLGAGLTKREALQRVISIESLTSVGGIAGIAFGQHTNRTLIGMVFSMIGGGFLYLVINSLYGAFRHKMALSIHEAIVITGTSFAFTGAFLWIVSRGFH